MKRMAGIRTWLDKPTTNIEIVLGNVAVVLDQRRRYLGGYPLDVTT